MGTVKSIFGQPDEVEKELSNIQDTRNLTPEQAMQLVLETTDIQTTDGNELKEMIVAQVKKSNELRQMLSDQIDRTNEISKERDELKRSNASLLIENLTFKSDSLYALYFALNRKGNETATSLNDFELSLKKDKDDKTFERFKMLMGMLPDMTKTISSLRNDYLQVSESEAAAVELKGVPLIEQRRKSGSGKGGLATQPKKPRPAEPKKEEYEL